MNFTEAMTSTLNKDYNVSATENGAVGYRTTGKALLDLNFSVASLRTAEIPQIIDKFVKAFFEDKMAAMKWLFFARDIRGGLGERRLFRIIMKYMADKFPEYIKPMIELTAEFARYDDLWPLLDTELRQPVINYVSWELGSDLARANNQQPIGKMDAIRKGAFQRNAALRQSSSARTGTFSPGLPPDAFQAASLSRCCGTQDVGEELV